MSTTLPGFNAPLVPALPGAASVLQLTPDQIAAIEASWNRLVGIQRALSEIMAVIDAHPELLAWARESQAGELRGS